MTITVEQGDASNWQGDADAVFTHPYAPLPASLHGKPSIINLFHPQGQWEKLRKYQAEEWLGDHDIHQIGQWGRGLRNTVYVANLEPRKVKLDDLIEDEFEPNIGWFPLELPFRLLKAYADIIKPGMTVWDGFCGRGSVGKVCQEFGTSYIGLDVDPSRVKLAREYLGLDPGP